MSAHIGNLKDENGDTFYPVTKTNAVFDENGNSLENVVIRDSNGDISMNASYSNNVKSYTKNFYNYNNDMRYCHIGTLKGSYSNQTFAGVIYTCQGYGGTDVHQEIIDFNVTIQNDQALHGFATFKYNEPPTQDEVVIYFVPTSNSWEWEVYLKMHSWSNAIVSIKMSAPSANDFKFTFDASDANFISYPDNAVLTITPRLEVKKVSFSRVMRWEWNANAAQSGSNTVYFNNPFDGTSGNLAANEFITMVDLHTHGSAYSNDALPFMTGFSYNDSSLSVTWYRDNNDNNLKFRLFVIVCKYE